MNDPADVSGDAADDSPAQRDFDVPETDIRESNPGGAGPRGLEGDLGISSERTGPTGSNPAGGGTEGTGSHGSAAHATDGVLDSTPGDVPGEHSGEPGEDPDVDRTLSTGVDRTVGEPNPDPVVNKHEFDPSRNPRH